MYVSLGLENLLKKRIRLRHQVENTDSILIRDVKEIFGEEGSVDHKDFSVLYNFEDGGISFAHLRETFSIEIADLIKQESKKGSTSDDARYTLSDKAPAQDMVNSPDHYKKRYIREVIQSIKGLCTPEEYRGYLKGSKIKYLARYQDKGGIEDLEKGQWYGDELIAFEKEQKNKTQEATQ